MRSAVTTTDSTTEGRVRSARPYLVDPFLVDGQMYGVIYGAIYPTSYGTNYMSLRLSRFSRLPQPNQAAGIGLAIFK